MLAKKGNLSNSMVRQGCPLSPTSDQIKLHVILADF